MTIAPAQSPYANPLALLSARVAGVILPPPFLTLSQWADLKAVIPPESNPVESGKWHTDRAEYLRGIMDAFTDSEVFKIPVMKSSRSGVTAGLVTNGITYHIDAEPTLIMYAVPVKDMALKYAKRQLEPTIRDTPCLANKILPPRVKGSQNTTLYKAFPGGNIQIVWATSKAFGRQETVRVFMADDVDAFPPDSNGEGDPLALGERRTKTVWNRKLIAISSPTLTGISRIESAYIASSQGHYYVPCPHCQHKQLLVFSKDSVFAKPTNSGLIGDLVHGYTDPNTNATFIGLRFDSDNCTWAYYVCENCGAQLGEREKREYMVPKGEWRHVNWENAERDDYGRRSVGFHINELYASFNSSFHSVALDFLKSKKEGALQVCINNVFGETYDHDSYTVSDHVLSQRKEPYEDVPEKAFMLTMGSDVQGDRIEYVVRAWGADNESWLIDYDVLHGTPYDRKTWSAFGELHQKLAYRHSSGVMMKPMVTFIDSGDFTHEVYAFTAPRRSLGIYASKGMRNERRHLVEPSKHRDKTTGAILMLLGVDQAKNTLYENLGRSEHGPNHVHFNHKATFNFFQQLTAEKRVPQTNRKGITTFTWVKKRDRNEVLDMFVMSYCAKEFLKLHLPRIEREFKKRVEKFKQQSANHPAIPLRDPQTGEPPDRKPKNRVIMRRSQPRSTF